MIILAATALTSLVTVFFLGKESGGSHFGAQVHEHEHEHEQNKSITIYFLGKESGGSDFGPQVHEHEHEQSSDEQSK